MHKGTKGKELFDEAKAKPSTSNIISSMLPGMRFRTTIDAIVFRKAVYLSTHDRLDTINNPGTHSGRLLKRLRRRIAISREATIPLLAMCCGSSSVVQARSGFRDIKSDGIETCVDISYFPGNATRQIAAQERSNVTHLEDRNITA